MDIRNSVFIVTGGGSGLGQATVETIVAGGGKAVIADVNRTTGEALATARQRGPLRRSAT